MKFFAERKKMIGHIKAIKHPVFIGEMHFSDCSDADNLHNQTTHLHEYKSVTSNPSIKKMNAKIEFCKVESGINTYSLFHNHQKNVNKIGEKIFLVEKFILILWREIYFPVLTNPSIIKVPFSSGIFLLPIALIKHTYI
ncbi:MAG: hypothetical protein HEQ40_11545 [Lacibacter sp.]